MQASVQKIARDSNSFPVGLKDIPDAPKELYQVGDLPSEPVAIVGTRRPTAYGRRMAGTLAARLAAGDIPVISGLAFGVDTIVHRAVLDAGGRSVAVLASGLDRDSVSPRTNLGLARRIAGRGALLSEYPPGTAARKEYFPARNRLISGLARCVVVVEGALPSGSLITARHAADQGREVWAFPGQLDSTVSRGTNHLISEGAQPLVDIDAFLETIGVNPAEEVSGHPLLAHFSAQPRHRDAVAEASGVAVGALDVELTKLDLAGLIRDVGDGYYVRT